MYTRAAACQGGGLAVAKIFSMWYIPTMYTNATGVRRDRWVNAARRAAVLSVAGLLVGAAPAAEVDPADIPADNYVTVNADGHLSANGERLRFWTFVGKTHGNTHEATDALLDRLQFLGVNGVRLWPAFRDVEYTPGDGSQADNVDYFISEAGKRGMRIWTAGMNRMGEVEPGDVDIIDDPATRDAWLEAVAAGQETRKGNSVRIKHAFARFWDPRLEAIALERKKQIAGHVNRHNGLRWADDPTFAVWELMNEEWWVRRMLNGAWSKMHPFFRNTLFDRWHAFLLEKYGSEEALIEAWGELMPGESLDDKSILFAPMGRKLSPTVAINDANPAAMAAVQAMETDYDPAALPPQRGADVLEFLVGLHVSYKDRQAAEMKKFGRAIGTSPMIYDTGIGYQIQSLYLHQNSDAIAMNAYVNGTGPTLEEAKQRLEGVTDPFEIKRLTQEAERLAATEDGGWVNWLEKPPLLSQGVPWLEPSRVEGKPFLVYETQIQQPAKYRAAYPIQMGTLASLQDWDWITWHYFGDGKLDQITKDPHVFTQAMDITTGGHSQGYHYTYDEVQNAMMRAMAFAWRHEALDPAPNPTTFTYGKAALYDPRSMSYGHSYQDTGLDMHHTTYQHGVRIKIDPEQEEYVKVEGDVVPFDQRNEFNPYTPTKQIKIDWKAGLLNIDAPAIVAYTGRIAAGSSLAFGNGVWMDDIEVENAPGMFDPVDEDNPFIAVAAYSEDGKPFADAEVVAVSLVSTSYNTGFELTGHTNKGIGKAGDLPVLTARVGGELRIPALAGRSYEALDWNGDVLSKGTVDSDGRYTFSADEPIFVVRFLK